MAKTKKENKIVCVGGYTKSNGTKVKGHRRSTPGCFIRIEFTT